MAWPSPRRGGRAFGGLRKSELRPQLYGREGFGLAVGLVGSEADRRAATSTGLAPAVTRLNERWVVRPSGRAHVAKGAGSGAIGCGHPSHQSPTPYTAVLLRKYHWTRHIPTPQMYRAMANEAGDPEAIDLPHQH